MAEKTVPARHEGRAEPARETTRDADQFAAPAVDIFEDSDGLTLLADLPGVRTDDISIEVKNDVLTLTARASGGSFPTGAYREFTLPNYFRQFQLADTVDVARISAEMKHGVLALKLPKAEEAKPRKIAVSVG